jgi:glycosyltransferase involved in cell wall biosynthesis
MFAENPPYLNIEMQKPEISIILPFFNATSSLARALESITMQSFAGFECVLIDNNSTDGSTEIAQDFCTKDRRFLLFHESRQGVMHAHSAGLSMSSSRYIARMDADDWMYPDRLERQFNFMEAHPEISVLAGQAEYIGQSSETQGFQRYVNWSNGVLSHRDIFLKQFVESPIINPTIMYRREVADTHGSYIDDDFPEDYELWLRWLSRGVTFHKLAKPVIKWYDSKTRLTRQDQRYSDQAFFKIKTQYLAKWLKLNNPHHPNVGVWGASRISRNRAKLLEKNGVQIDHYIDISKKRQLDKLVMYYKDIPNPDTIFILVYLKEETMRADTIRFLLQRGFREGVNFVLAS